MKFILFGAGDIGLRAFKVLGEDNVECFADNYKYGSYICGKRVISFNEMVGIADRFCIVITSNDYIAEFEKQLKDEGIDDYIVFNRRNNGKLIEVLPKYNYLYNTQYMHYTDILLNYQIDKYKKIVIWGSNKYLKNLLLEIAILSNLKNVIGIIELETDQASICGIPVVKLEDVQDKIDCLVINKKRTETNIREDLYDVDYNVIDVFDVDKFVLYNRHPELVKYKNIHKGKRVFIIGNGPSLQIEDLEKLYKHNEICFGLNKIHKIYPKTNWKPDYICMSDTRVISACENELENITDNSTVFMADRYLFTQLERVNNVEYVHLKSEEYEPYFPGFSENIVDGVYLGYTVTYDLALQIAAYMGFDEIYLIGMDHNNIGMVTDKKNHFIPNYFTEDEISIYKNVTANFEGMDIAYKKADVYSRKKGFRIYNATRGGKLEVFERVDFDSLF